MMHGLLWLKEFMFLLTGLEDLWVGLSKIAILTPHHMYTVCFFGDKIHFNQNEKLAMYDVMVD